MGNPLLDDETDPFVGLGSLTTNVNFGSSIRVGNESYQFLGTLALESSQAAANFPGIQ